MKDILKLEKLSGWVVSVVLISIATLSIQPVYAGRGGHVGHTGTHTPGSGQHTGSHSTGAKSSSSSHIHSSGYHTSNSSSGGHANHSSSSHTSTSSAHTGESSGVHSSSGHHNTHIGENSNHINAQFRAGNHPIASTTKPYTTVNKQPLTSNRVLNSGLSIQTMPPLKTSTGLNSATITKLQPHLSKQQVQPVKSWKAGPVKSKHTGSASKNKVDYHRPSNYRMGMRDKVWNSAKESSTGQVRDPGTGRFMNRNKPWDMGHKPGHEFKKHKKSAEKRGITRKEFLNEYNNPDIYRPELPSSNRSHRGEDKTNRYLGP